MFSCYENGADAHPRILTVKSKESGDEWEVELLHHSAVVFSTDATGVAGIKVAGIFPKDSHPPIVFPAALLSARHNGDAVRFFEFLTAPKTAVLFQSFGYHALAIAH